MFATTVEVQPRIIGAPPIFDRHSRLVIAFGQSVFRSDRFYWSVERIDQIMESWVGIGREARAWERLVIACPDLSVRQIDSKAFRCAWERWATRLSPYDTMPLDITIWGDYASTRHVRCCESRWGETMKIDVWAREHFEQWKRPEAAWDHILAARTPPYLPARLSQDDEPSTLTGRLLRRFGLPVYGPAQLCEGILRGRVQSTADEFMIFPHADFEIVVLQGDRRGLRPRAFQVPRIVDSANQPC